MHAQLRRRGRGAAHEEAPQDEIFKPLDFVALYVGGNDLVNGKPVDDIALDIKVCQSDYRVNKFCF